MLVAGQVEQLVQKEEELAKQAAELTEKDARIAALLEAAAAPSVMGQQEQQATQKMVAVLTKSKKLKTCTVMEAQDAIRAVGLDKQRHPLCPPPQQPPSRR